MSKAENIVVGIDKKSKRFLSVAQNSDFVHIDENRRFSSDRLQGGFT